MPVKDLKIELLHYCDIIDNDDNNNNYISHQTPTNIHDKVNF